MNLTELSSEHPPQPTRSPDPLNRGALISQMGGEVGHALSSALERVSVLMATGRIDRGNLRALFDEVARARRAAMMAQQASRLADGALQISREQLDLTSVLLSTLRQASAEMERRGIELRPVLARVDVRVDPALLSSLLQALLDWAFEHAVTPIDVRLDIKESPAHARLACAFGHRRLQHAQEGASLWPQAEESALETVSWCLLQETAKALGLVVFRHDTNHRTTLNLEFPDTVAQRIDGLSTSELGGASAFTLTSQPLAGRHVLVLSSHRDVRNLVREALRPMGMMIDFVGSVVEAEAFCHDGLPHAMVYESSLAGERFERLRADMLAQVPQLAFVQIVETGKSFEVLSVGGRQFSSVCRESIVDALPAAMLYEMASGER